MSPQAIKGIGDLSSRYDHFIIDQFGVLHDGQHAYPGAVETLAKLRETAKSILLLSNSGKRSAPNEARLIDLGFIQGSWTHFLSSGEVAWQRLRKDEGARKRCLLIARNGDTSAFDGLNLEMVETGVDADFVLLAASEGDRFNLDHYRALLEPAAARSVPCLCTNPDKIMLTAVGPRFGAGRIAELYEELGGEVTWIGKPFPEIYAAALALLGNPDTSRVVCVGDSIEHDIAGGAGVGLATALVTTGILANLDDAARAALFREHRAEPDYIMPAFTW